MSVVDLQQMENNPPSPSEEKSLHYQKTNRLTSLLKKRDRSSETPVDPTELFDSGTDEEDCYLPNTLRIASPKRHSSSSAIMQKKPLSKEQSLNAIAAAAAAGTKAAPVAVTGTTRTAQSPSRNVTHSPSSSLSSSPKQTKAGPSKKKSVSMKVYNQSPKRVSSSVTAHTTQQRQAFQEEEAIVETSSETSSSEGEQEEEDSFVDARGTQETTNTSVPLHIEAPKNRNQGLSLDSSSSSLPPSRQGSRRPPLASKENKMEMENTGIPEPVSPPKVKRGILRASTSKKASSISSEPLQSPLSKPKPLKRQSSLLSPRSQRNRHSNRVSFADKDGGEISSHVTIDVSPNRLSRRVKRAGDRSSPPGSPDRSASVKTSRVLVLLMDPIKKQYELTSISYAPTVPARKGSSSSGQEESTPIRTLLDLIPAAVSHKPLKNQVYTGFCRPNVGKEMVNLLTVEDYAIRDDEVLIAIPENFKGSDCIILAKPILADPRLVRLLKKLKRNEKKKKQLRPPSSAVSNDKLMSTIEKDKAIEKVDRADINLTSWRTIAKLLSFLLVLFIFVKMAVDEEMKNRIPSVLSFELDQFNLEQFHRDSTSLAVGGWKSGENIAKNQTHSEPKNVFLAGIKEFVMSIDGDFI